MPTLISSNAARNCYCPCTIAIQIRNMLFFIWCMFHHLLVTLLSTFFVQTEIYISCLILVQLHKWYPNYSWSFHELHNQPWCCSILLQLMKKKLLAHGTLLHFRWTAPKGPMNWIIHVGDWCHPFYDGVDYRYGSHHEVCSFLVRPFAKDPACWVYSCATVLALSW